MQSHQQEPVGDFFLLVFMYNHYFSLTITHSLLSSLLLFHSVSCTTARSIIILLARECLTPHHDVELASFPGSPSFRAIVPRMTFDPPEGKAEGEPGRFCHMTSVMLRPPYIRYRRGRSHTLGIDVADKKPLR